MLLTGLPVAGGGGGGGVLRHSCRAIDRTATALRPSPDETVPDGREGTEPWSGEPWTVGDVMSSRSSWLVRLAVGIDGMGQP